MQILPAGHVAALRARHAGGRPPTFNFLGFTFYWGKPRKGYWRLKYTRRKVRFAPMLKGLRDFLRWETRGEPAPVEYRVHYSHDDGDTWLPISHRLVATGHEIDLDQLPGGQSCRLRVRATNCVRSSEAVGDSFSVAVKPCRAIIQQLAPVINRLVDLLMFVPARITVLGNNLTPKFYRIEV